MINKKRITDLTYIESCKTERRGKVIGHGIWVTQGVQEESMSQIYIADFEIQKWIDALEEMKISLTNPT